MVMRPATQSPAVSALPSFIDIDAEISALESHLASLLAQRDARRAEPVLDTEPWILDHGDDEWSGSPAVGSTAFWRRAHRTALLSAEEEKVLAHRIEAGVFAQERLDSGIELRRTERRGLEHVAREGAEARERMILTNLRLVASIARTLLRRAAGGMDFEDLQQAGVFGLMRAVDGFDHTMDMKFSTYATWWIRQTITRALDDEARTIRLPVHMLERIRRLDAARRREGLTWAEALASPSRLGADVTEARVDQARRLLRPCLSLDAVTETLDVVDDTDDVTVVETWLTEAQVVGDCLDHLASLRGLGPRAVEVIELRFGLTGEEPMTLDTIGRRFDVTRERIRQIEKKALDALRELFDDAPVNP